MLFLGTLALIQMLILPGALVLAWIRFKGGTLQRLVFTIGLSLIGNYVIVFFLTAVHLYRQVVILAIFVAQLAALAWLSRETLLAPLGQTLRRAWLRLQRWLRSILSAVEIAEDESLGSVLRKALYAISLILGLMSLAWIGYRFVRNLGTVFDGWDAVVSWNAWALSWAGNIIPTTSRYYPQLIPINWSLTYVFMANAQVQFFAKAMMPLFPLLGLLLMLDLGLERRSAGPLLGVVISILIFRIYLSEEISNGYVDHAVAAFGFLSIATLLKAHSAQDREVHRQAILLGGLFAAGAAVTKEAGVYILLVYPLLAYLILIRPSDRPVPKWVWRQLALAVGLSVLIAAPWYVFKQITFAMDVDSSQIGRLIDFTSSRYAESGALGQLRSAFTSMGILSWLLLLLIPALGILRPAYRWITILIIFPYVLLWVFVASYDFRNLSIALPFIGLVAGMALDAFRELSSRLLPLRKVGTWPTAVVPVILVLALLAMSAYLGSETLVDRQVNLQRQLFSPSKNEMVYALIAERGEETRILTNYPLQYLPDLKDNQISYWFRDYDQFSVLMEDPYFDFLLVPSYADPLILEYIEQGLADGSLRRIFEDDQWISFQMIEILGRVPD